MPISVPSSPKVLTTKYQNWRGVDYTNDPSNVWYRRSPNGLNMLPNLDGQPFKRSGWKVEFTAQDFINVSGVVGVDAVEQYKVDYFELGGAEYLWFYTSIGCFYYSNALTFVDTSYEVGDDKPYEFSKSLTYNVGDYCMCSGTMYKCIAQISTPTSTLPSSDSTHWTSDDVDGSKPFSPSSGDIDYSKSFFFEGGGTAGYYLFVNDKLFMFDGEKLIERKPKIPVVITMAGASGEGEMLEDVNILTTWIAVDYVCDGATTKYNLLGGVEAVQNVYTINADGSFTPNYNWTMQNIGELDFGGNPPQETRPNQPSMRVIYRSANATITEVQTYTGAYTIQVAKEHSDAHMQEYKNGAWRDTGLVGYGEAYYKNVSTKTIALSNAKKPVSLQIESRATNSSSASWTQNSSAVDATVNSYGSSALVSGKNNGKTLYEQYHGYVLPGNVSLNGKTTTSESYVTSDATHRTRFVTTTNTISPQVRLKYTQWNVSSGATDSQRDAFFAASKCLVYGNGIINQVFLTASKFDAYSTRVWYSAATDPLYFPDTNYIEVGATDKHIMGLIKVDDYLGIIKQGSATDTSVYLAYATSFEDITTYAVKQSVNGIGAISNGAFNILNGEPLFLSAEGVMGIEPAEDESRKIRNRSYYINKPLLQEPSLESAFSFVYKGMYWLCVNNHCYVLDGSQKVSWENTKTNLQYECYYLDNIPAKCFAQKDGLLWFVDGLGNVCRFKSDADEFQYVDAYNSSAISNEYAIDYKADDSPVQNTFYISDLSKMQSVSEVVKEGLFPDVPPWVTPWEIPQDWYDNGLIMDCEREYYEVSSLSFRFWVNQGYTEEGGVYLNPTINPPYTTSTVNGVTRVSIAAGYDWITNIGQYGNLTDAALDGYREYSFTVVGYETVSASEITVGDVIQQGTAFYTVSAIDTENQTVTVEYGVPILARWGTIADDDGSANYYKKLQKRGSLVAVMPMSDSGVKVYLNPDGKPEDAWTFVGETDIGNNVLPFNYYLRKKVKNYKRLQIICMNDSYNDGFGIDEIIKCYTLGNYAKK